MIHPDLRPLTIGEILDRAVTLFVKRFAVLTLILALVAIPLAVLGFAAQPQTLGFVADIQQILALPPGHADEQRALLSTLSAKNRFGATAAALVIASWILSSLSATACMIAVAQAYAGRLPSVRAVYREAVRRWPAQLAASVLFVAFAFVIGIVVSIVTLLLVLALGAVGGAARPLSIALAIVAMLAIVAFAILFYFVVQMTYVSIALEDANPIRGIARSLRRTLSPAVFWRSALVAVVVFAVSLVGFFVITAIGATLAALTHLSALDPVVTVIGGVALNAVVTTFAVLYAIDVRVRREGYDLLLAAQEPAARS